MAGKRLRDAALLLNATRSVAKESLRLRQARLDVWTKTSTVGKAVKDQTDRVTLTAQAAIALANRLNDQVVQSQPPPPTTLPPSPRASKEQDQDRYASGSTSTVREAFERDHRHDQIADDIRIASQQSVGHELSSEIPREQDSDLSKNFKTRSPPPLPTEKQVEDLDESDAGNIPDGVNIDVFQTARGRSLLPHKYAKAKAERQPKAPGTVAYDTTQASAPLTNAATSFPPETSGSKAGDVEQLAADIAQDTTAAQNNETSASTPPEHVPYQMHESRVPSSRLGRIWQYSGLATSMAFGAVGEGWRRATGSGSAGGSLMLSASNMERLVSKLSRMRGAALKLGQMISFQDLKMLPAPIHEVLQRVQDNADYMPAYQRNGVLAANLGSEWRTLFAAFDEVPMAAASIGQVHRATLASDGRAVAVKIQYPGVATSIDSDLNNLSILLTASRLLPRGLFLDKTIANARTELAWETDYEREAKAQMRFKELLSDEPDVFRVPAVISEACGPQVLTAELMEGTAVTKGSLKLSQEQRDWIGTQILRLCFRELAEFSFMQTDPNWTNFLYNATAHKIELLDFGAARDYPERFVRPYVSVLMAAAEGDRNRVRDLSVELGYLTGAESKAMRDAHVASVLTLAEPFSTSNGMDDVYDFKDQTVTDRVRSEIPLMVRERLAPPPEETYSLHRKLSGAFLLLARLGSRVKTRAMFVAAMDAWKARNHVS